MTKAMTADRPDRRACGFVDNASALPTTPQAPPHQQGRTFDVSYKADIFTRYGQSQTHTPTGKSFPAYQPIDPTVWA